MRPTSSNALLTYAVLTLAGGFTFTMPEEFSPQSANGAAELPEEIQLTGIVRDFQEKNVPGGHTDFERKPNKGFGRYSANVATELGADGKPVFVTGGMKVNKEWKDSLNRAISYTVYDAALGDQIGTWGESSTGGITSAESFDQWYRDVPGVNLSAPLTLTLVRDADGSYVFDDKTDPEYQSKGGFFPIDDQLYGNSAGTPNHNFHFTFELRTEFTYDAEANQVFKFTGDDDVFVFIDGKLVIDLGGVHSAVSQHVELNRLGLTDGQTYSLDFFFAERHRTQSNFRMQTNLVMTSSAAPSVTCAFD